jgi:hypothetical protein
VTVIVDDVAMYLSPGYTGTSCPDHGCWHGWTGAGTGTGNGKSHGTDQSAVRMPNVRDRKPHSTGKHIRGGSAPYQSLSVSHLAKNRGVYRRVCEEPWNAHRVAR